MKLDSLPLFFYYELLLICNYHESYLANRSTLSILETFIANK